MQKCDRNTQGLVSTRRQPHCRPSRETAFIPPGIAPTFPHRIHMYTKVCMKVITCPPMCMYAVLVNQVYYVTSGCLTVAKPKSNNRTAPVQPPHHPNPAAIPPQPNRLLAPTRQPDRPSQAAAQPNNSTPNALTAAPPKTTTQTAETSHAHTTATAYNGAHIQPQPHTAATANHRTHKQPQTTAQPVQ